MIQSPIENDYIKVNFYDGNGGANTEIRHKVLLQSSIHELHIYMLKKNDTGFSMAYY